MCDCTLIGFKYWCRVLDLDVKKTLLFKKEVIIQMIPLAILARDGSSASDDKSYSVSYL